MKELFLPSLISLLIPLAYLSVRVKGSLEPLPVLTPHTPGQVRTVALSRREGTVMLVAGLGMLLFVPIFKTLTHLPPYLGILLGLGIVWVVSEILHKDKDEAQRHPFTASHALSRIDASSVLFFLGILLAIGSLESTGLLQGLARWMDRTIGNQDLIVGAIGLASAVIDNVPLVAASMGMYDLATFPPDSKIWQFLAYCAGTGGSLLIIGSAAGVAVMGMEKIDFLWYLRTISFVALLGYLAGALAYLAIFAALHG